MTVSPSLVRNRSGGRFKLKEEAGCRMCGNDWRRREPAPHQSKLTRHHLVPQCWFDERIGRYNLYRDCDANIVPLCRRCHDLVDHRDPVVARPYRRALRARLWQEEVAFCIQLRGKQWFDEQYPQRPAEIDTERARETAA